MKTLKIAVILVVTAVLLIGTANVAMARARTHVSVGIGIGHPYGGYYHYRPYRGHHYPRSEFFIGVGGPVWQPGYYDYYYPYYPGYYAVEPPPVVVERPPAVVQPPTIAPQGVDEKTQKVFKELRYKKSELMRKLEIGDKNSQIQAIRDLAGFSFDDNVHQAIENVLLTNTDAQLRTAAAEALGSVKNTKSLPALEKARVDDTDAGVRRAADAAINNIEGN
jgi:hypothetical protein